MRFTAVQLVGTAGSQLKPLLRKRMYSERTGFPHERAAPAGGRATRRRRSLRTSRVRRGSRGLRKSAYVHLYDSVEMNLTVSPEPTTSALLTGAPNSRSSQEPSPGP